MDRHTRDEIASSLIALTGSLKLYPPGHPAVKAPLSRFMEAVRPHIFQKNHLFIRLFEGLVVVEGDPVYNLAGQSEELFELFHSRGLEGFELHRGIQEQEILIFLQTLIGNQEAKGKEIQKILTSKGVKRITVILLKEEEDLTKKAQKIYREAKKLIVDIIKEGREGKLRSDAGEKTVEVMEEFNEILETDINAVLPLVILQDYDEYTFNHCVNVGILSLALARALELNTREAVAIGVGGMLHDIGKTRIPKKILLKTSKLTREEWELLKAHPVFGAQMAREMAHIDEYSIKVIYQHHVGADLKGYPSLKNPGELLKGAIIVATADNYDAMTTQRPYQPRFEPSQALEIMRKKVGGFLDKTIFEHFVKMLGKYPLGSIVRLDTAEVGIVSRINLENPDRPYVKIVMDEKGNKLEKPYEVNTAEIDPSTGKPIRQIVGLADPLTRGLIDVTHYFSFE